MRILPWLALLLIVMWVVLRVALAVTSGLLHLLWIAAVLFIIVSLVSKFRSAKTH